MIPNGRVGDWRLGDDDFLATCRLPSSADKRETLQKKNPVVREDRMTFDEASHTYTFDGRVVPRSVTTIVHQFSDEFDPESAITAMRASDNWEWKQFKFLKEDDSVMDDTEITALWRKNGQVARSRGTLMHWQIEMFLNGAEIEQPQSPEFMQFMLLYETMQLRPYRTELSIYHSGLDVAGQIDALCVGAYGLEIWDWKRSKEIQMDAFRQMKFPLHHLPDSNYYHYGLQLNLYRYILESEYDMPISRMCLGVFHPLCSHPICVEIPRMTEIDLILEFENICDFRIAALAQVASRRCRSNSMTDSRRTLP